MLPRLPQYNIANCALTHIEPLCQFVLIHFAKCVNVSNGNDINLGQTRIVMLFSVLIAMLRDHISNIVSRGTKKEMCGVHASRGVANVAHKLTVGNRFMRQLPGEAVCVNMHILGDVETAISHRSPFVIFPHPAGVWTATTVNLTPKSLFKRLDAGEVVALTTAELPSTPTQGGRIDLERSSTVCTDSFDFGDENATLGRHVSGPITDVPCRRVSHHRVGFSLSQLYPTGIAI